jgi:hypothetical protein
MTDGKWMQSGVLVVANSQSDDVKLTLEPWAEERTLPAGATAEIMFSGPPGGRLEVELVPGGVIVYGWEGSLLEVRVQTSIESK